MDPRPTLLRAVGKREASKIAHICLEDLTSTYERQSVQGVRPWIGKDIEGNQPVKMQAFVGMLLSRCREERSHSNMDDNIKLFDACRQTIGSAWTKKLLNKTPSPIITNLHD